MPKKFVIHKHERIGHKQHWDLMLESENVLITFRSDYPPEELKRNNHQLQKIFDHDPKFLNYQGPVNNGEGDIKMQDGGFFAYSIESKNLYLIEFDGDILKGNFKLQHASDDRWEFGPC